MRALVDEPRVDVTDGSEGRIAEGRAVAETSSASGSLADIPFDNAVAGPDSVIVKRKIGDGWVPVTAARLRDEVVAVARGLIARGIEPGARVGIMARTSYEWMLLDLGHVVRGRGRRPAVSDLCGGTSPLDPHRAESIRAFTIVTEDFTEENWLLTPSLKLRRVRIHERYTAEIDALYSRSM